MKQTKITKSARGENCSLRIPGVCNHDSATVVFCHAPSVGSGMGLKSPSWWGSYGCAKCHDAIDNRNNVLNRKFTIQGYELSPFMINWLWLPAIYETQRKLIEKGLIEVKK